MDSRRFPSVDEEAGEDGAEKIRPGFGDVVGAEVGGRGDSRTGPAPW
jgi:hypothetical protein